MRSSIFPLVTDWKSDLFSPCASRMFIHNTDLVVIRNCTFSDNVWGLHLNQDARISVENSRFVGVSANSASSCPSVPTFGFIVDQGRSIDLAQSIYPNYMRKLK